MESIPSEKRIIAKVCSAHGIKGEIKVFPLVDTAHSLRDVDVVSINEQDFHLESFRPAKQFLIFKLKEIKDRNTAETLSGYISAHIDDELEKDEFFIQDLFNLKVLNENQEELGVVNDISELGQIKIFVKLNESLKKRNPLIVPFVEEFIDEVNIKEGFIKIKESESLLSLNS